MRPDFSGAAGGPLLQVLEQRFSRETAASWMRWAETRTKPKYLSG